MVPSSVQRDGAHQLVWHTLHLRSTHSDVCVQWVSIFRLEFWFISDVVIVIIASFKLVDLEWSRRASTTSRTKSQHHQNLHRQESTLPSSPFNYS
ncbi:hypothetical protein CDAR_307181 [Caerostris darwini]|uniref:Uncharacterized protein n=1 Tax=Caerostris darwini TaxID=1538125 RepID=A0AAV4P079_9ARAC|nr:hypothetical protein CDAR_307181 [Caerostris darwini]